MPEDNPSIKLSPDTEPALDKLFSSSLENVHCVRDYPVKNTDGRATFVYRDVGDWEKDHQLLKISLQDLPEIEPVRRVMAGFTAEFPLHDYSVNDMPWDLLITNCHNRPAYELLKNKTVEHPLTVLNWDKHEDIYYSATGKLYDPSRNRINNWVFTADYFGLTSPPHYHFEQMHYRDEIGNVKVEEIPLSKAGAWTVDETDIGKNIPRNEQYVVTFPFIVSNIPPETDTVIDYYKNILKEASPKSIWLSLDADCFSPPRSGAFDPAEHKANLLKEIIEGAYEYADRIALMTFARSPEYTADVPGVNAFFVQTLKTHGITVASGQK